MRVTDGGGLSADFEVLISIIDAQEPPTIGVADQQDITENTQGLAFAKLVISDPDAAD